MVAMKLLMPKKGYLKLRQATLVGLKLNKYVTYLEGTAILNRTRRIGKLSTAAKS
jgi:hypothetical protein